jgi:hypothetical protein
VRVDGCYVQRSGGLAVTVADRDDAALCVDGPAWLDDSSTLTLDLAPGTARHGAEIRVLESRALHGAFGSVTVTTPGLRAEPRYSATGLTVRLRPAT